MFGANMIGSEKILFLFTSKYKAFRCLENIKKLSSAYFIDKKARMTGQIYEKWLKELNLHFEKKNHKILLVVENCTALIEVSMLKVIHLVFLPPNITTVLQPMDREVINLFKRNYGRLLLKRFVLNLEMQH